MCLCTIPALYRCKLWQQDHCQHHQKASPDGSTLEGKLNASDDPLEVVDRKDTARKTRTKEFIEKVQAIIDETPQRPIRQTAGKLGVSHNCEWMCGGGFEV